MFLTHEEKREYQLTSTAFFHRMRALHLGTALG